MCKKKLLFLACFLDWILVERKKNNYTFIINRAKNSNDSFKCKKY